MKDITVAWQQALDESNGVAIEALAGEQQIAILHAQEYMRLIANAPSFLLCEQALQDTFRYLQSLRNCHLIEQLAHKTLNHQALILVDRWKLASPLSFQQSVER
jgi:hypothetical protein